MHTQTVQWHLFGLGYVGRFFKEKYPESKAYSRSQNSINSSNSANLQSECSYFDAENPQSYPEILKNEGQWQVALVTLALDKLNPMAFSSFCTWLLIHFDQVVLYSTTGVYLNQNLTIQDDSPLDPYSERARREHIFAQKGALILTLAGIWGPERHPVNWLKKKLISQEKQAVNLIHVTDIIKLTALITHKKLENPELPARWILHDGALHLWEKIEFWAKSEGLLDSDFTRESKNLQSLTGSAVQEKRIQARRLNEYFKDYLFFTAPWNSKS